MLEFDSCCCCIPLRTGCLVIGYLYLIGSVIVTIITILTLSAGTALAYSDVDDAGALNVVLAISSVLLALIAIYLAFNIILVVGIHKEKPGHVKAYLQYSLMFLVIYIILFIVSLVTGVASVAGIIERILEILLSVYFLLVIRSHYLDMLKTEFTPACFN